MNKLLEYYESATGAKAAELLKKTQDFLDNIEEGQTQYAQIEKKIREKN